MNISQKLIQYFIIASIHAVESVLELLRTDIAQSLGISQDYSVRILELDNNNTKHIPIQIKNVQSLDNDLQVLQKEIKTEIRSIFLPWDETWTQSRKITDLHENLRTKLSQEILDHIPKTFDSIGNLAIIEVDRWGELSEQIRSNSEFQHILALVGNTIIKLHKNITTVLRKEGNIEGEFRIRNYEVISGPSNTSTLHKENNCKFYVDPRKMFFSPRLSYERNRVSSLEFNKNSIILDCFAGCGPYSIQIALKHNVNVYGIEKNPDAATYFERNVALNRSQFLGMVNTFNGDFREFINSEKAPRCKKKADYLIMNLPERATEFIPDIVPFVRKDTTYLVFYSFLKSSTPLQDVEEKLREILNINNLIPIEIVQKRIVFSYSPNQNNVGIDVKIRNEN